MYTGSGWILIGYTISYALMKTTVFCVYYFHCFRVLWIYETQGGALEVGQASTKAVVVSSILIILFNLVLTQLLLNMIEAKADK
jgi:phospholipid/cholesterol/gamma-HCH transport system permease protein